MNDSPQDVAVETSMAEPMPSVGDRKDTLSLLKVVLVGILVSLDAEDFCVCLFRSNERSTADHRLFLPGFLPHSISRSRRLSIGMQRVPDSPFFTAAKARDCSDGFDDGQSCGAYDSSIGVQ